MLAVLPILGGMLLWMARAFDFHEKYFVKRRLKRVAELSDLVKDDEPINGFLNKLLTGEAFRVSTGILAAPRKMEALMELYCSGFWTIGEIRSVCRYVVINEQSLRPSLKFSWGDIAGAWGELVFALVMMAVGFLSSYKLITSGSKVAVLAGFVVLLLYLVTGTVMSTGFRKYRRALGVKALIAKNPHLFPHFDCE